MALAPDRGLALFAREHLSIESVSHP